MKEHIINEIKNYMENPLNCAILLEGSWGSGKTYFIKNELLGIDKYYISLNGISNLSSLAFQLIYQICGTKIIGTKAKESNKPNRVVKTLGSLAVAYFDNKIDNSISEYISLLDDIDFKNKLIILDDLERCSLPIEEIMGFINNIVEHNNIKVIIITNEKEIKEKICYLKIKEKLIYQTLKFYPDLEYLYSILMPKKIEEIKKNKDFCICELKRKEHYNIRTLQFIFQRYIELRKILNKCLKDLECSSSIKNQIYNDIFQYMIVISRDYKIGENINTFKDNSKMSYYQLSSNLSQSITSFKFVNDFIQGIYIDDNLVTDILRGYINELNSSSSNENSPLNILNRWWEAEDEEILKNTNSILENLSKNTYSFDLYPKIILYLIKIINVGFSEKILNTAIEYMMNNIDKCDKYVTLGYRSIDASLSTVEKQNFDLIINKFIDYIDTHNHLVNKDGASEVKTKRNGEKGKYLYNWCKEIQQELLEKKKFLKEVGIDNIIYIVNDGNVMDVNYLIYLFNDTYNYRNFTDIYPNEYEGLTNLHDKLLSCNSENFSIMKSHAYKNLIEDINKFINNIKS